MSTDGSDSGSKKDEESFVPPPNGFTAETLSKILPKIDKHLAYQIVMSAIGRDYRKVADMMITVSDIIYCREIQKAMEASVDPLQRMDYEALLLSQGWIVGKKS